MKIAIMMKHYTLFWGGLLCFFLPYFSFAQCTANINSSGHCGTLMTTYTDPSASDGTDDPIYTYHGTGTLTGYLTAGIAVTFEWYRFNPLSNSYDPIAGNMDTQTNLDDGGYLVRITDNLANVCEARAWVWNSSIIADAGDNPTTICSNGPVVIDGSTTPTTEDYTYYDPVTFLPTSVVDATTEITLELNAEHSYVSDLNFYLVGPPECGSPRLQLGGIDEDGVCNSGDDILSLIFSSTSSGNYDICNLSTPINGTFGLNNGVPINWTAFNGCNFFGEWTIEVYDCQAVDAGVLTFASLTFQNAITTANYNSGGLFMPINDNSCFTGMPTMITIPASPPIVFPPPITITNTAAAGNGVTANPNGGFEWSSSPSPTGPWTAFENTDLSLVVNPADDTYYQLAVEDASGCLSTDVVFVDVDTDVPDAAFACAAVAVNKCDGIYSLNQLDNNPTTAATSTGAFGGALANYLTGSPAPGANATFDPMDLPSNTPLNLTYTLTSTNGCASTVTCTFTIIDNGMPNAGGY